MKICAKTDVVNLVLMVSVVREVRPLQPSFGPLLEHLQVFLTEMVLVVANLPEKDVLIFN